MTTEAIKTEVQRLQSLAGKIKAEVGGLRTAINNLESAVTTEREEVEQRAYERGFAEGRTRKELSEEQDDEIRVGDVVRHKRQPEIEVYVTDIYEEDGQRFGGISLKTVEHCCDVGDRYGGCRPEAYEKTGRHFDIEKLLEAMKE